MLQTPQEQLRTKTVNTNELFKSDFYQVSSNQRDYSWQKKHREKLWNDLVSTKELKEENPHEVLGHFLGAIVIISSEEQSRVSKRWDVIDGQQRMTSITILAAVLKDFIEPLKEKFPDLFKQLDRTLDTCFIENDYISFDKGGKAKLKLELNRAHDLYEKCLVVPSSHAERVALLQDDGLLSKSEKPTSHVSDIEKNIINAFLDFNCLIKNYLISKGIDAENPVLELKAYGEEINRIVFTLNNLFYFLFVRVTNDDIAYKIFETLNERGLKLSQADLIKNTILKHADIPVPSQKLIVEKKWYEFVDLYDEQELNRLDLTQYIQFSYSSRHKTVKKDDSFDEIDSVLSSERMDPVHLMEEIYEDAGLWNSFLIGNNIKWDSYDIDDSQFAILNPLWKAHCTPLIMACMRNITDNDQLKESLALIEKFLFREGLINGMSAGNLQRVFSAQALDMEENGFSVERLRQKFIEESRESDFVENFKLARVNTKQGFYIMRAIEKYLRKESGSEDLPQNQGSARHLEHILPKSPDESWLGVEDQVVFKDYLSRIGNFLILSDDVNVDVSNSHIKEKLNNNRGLSYADCNYEVTKDFCRNVKTWLSSGNWTFESIEKRQSYLANEYALQVWSYTN